MQQISQATILITSPMAVSIVTFDGINDRFYVLVSFTWKTGTCSHLGAPSQSVHTPWPVCLFEVKGSRVASRKDE